VLGAVPFAVVVELLGVAGLLGFVGGVEPQPKMAKSALQRNKRDKGVILSETMDVCISA
jgi:hypothetical protein